MKKITMRDAFFDGLYRIAKKDRHVIIVSADMGAPSLDKFKSDLSSQFINVGIAEENMVTVATGLALSGKKVFIYAIMPFATLRCYEMIKVNLSLMNMPVTVVGVGAGFSYDESGPTHHSTEDITIMRVLPNMTIFSPSDSTMAANIAEVSYKTPAPSYVRLDRKVLPLIYSKQDNFFSGMNMLKNGKDVCIIASGNMVHIALEISDTLAAHAVSAGVLDLYRLKPVDVKLLLKNIQKSKRAVTLEEHLLAGGIGSIVSEAMADCGKSMPLKRIGIKDRYYYTYGGRQNIQSLCGLDAKSITETVLNWQIH